MASQISRKKKKTRQELNDEARLLKKKRKHKGLPSGSKQADADTKNRHKSSTSTSDPRIGSKKPIPLIADVPTQPTKAKTVKAAPVKLSPEQELEKLENDPKLEQLLDRIDLGETLPPKDQQYLDRVLDRIDALMNILGYEYDEDDDEQEEGKDDIMKLLKQ